MEHRKWAWLRTAGAAAAAAVLLAVGGIRAVREIMGYEALVQSAGIREDLMEPLHLAGLRFLGDAAMAVAGISILLVLLLHRVSRNRRELQSLRKRNAAMEDLQRRTRELAHVQRLELMGTMTSAIAHEFNNLLTPIMGYSLMALEKLPEEDTEVYDGIVEIYNASQKAKALISRLSDLSRKNTENTFRLLSPDELVRKALEAAAPAKKDNVDIKLSLNCWDQRIRANELQLSQLVLNLIINAFHAMEPAGGTLTMETGFDEDTVFLKVRDTGCGIPEENRKRIFDPFFTTKEPGKGTGLGLAIAAQTVEDHHGTIRVTSIPGEETEFTVRLPRNE